MQLSAVCAADTVSAQPRRQTEEGCSLRLTPLTLGQQSETNKAGEQHTHPATLTTLLTMPLYQGNREHWEIWTEY